MLSKTCRSFLAGLTFACTMLSCNFATAAVAESSVKILERSASAFDLLSVRADIEAAEGILSGGGRSELVSAELDCRQRVALIHTRTIFSGVHLSGAQWSGTSADAEWQPVMRDTVIAHLLIAACSAASDQMQAQTQRLSIPRAPDTRPAHSPSPERKSLRVYTLQVGSFPTEGGAREHVQALKRRLGGDPFKATVEEAMVHGRIRFRGILITIAPEGDSPILCAQVNAHGAPCLLRKVGANLD